MAGAVAAGIRAGRAFIEMGLNDAALQTGLKAAEAKLGSFGASLAKVGASVGALGLSLTAPILAASEKFAEGGSALANASLRTGMSVEALSQLSHAAKMTGTDLASMEAGVRRMQKSLTAGSLESEQAAQSFANLGLSVVQLTRLRVDQQFAIISRALGRVQNDTLRAGAAMSIFGRGGSVLLPYIKNFDELNQESREFGLVTSKESAASALALQRSTNLLNAALGKITSTIGSAVAPTWTAWNIAMAHNLKIVKDVIAQNKPLIVAIYNVGFGLVVAGGALVAFSVGLFALRSGLKAIGSIVSLVVGTFKLIPAALALISSPMALIIVGLGTIAYQFFTATEAGRRMGAALGGVFRQLLATARIAFGGISDALSAGEFKLAIDVFKAALKLGTLEATASLKVIWADFFGWFTSRWTAIQDSFSRGLIEIGSLMKTIGLLATFDKNKMVAGFVSIARDRDVALKAIDDARKVDTSSDDKAIAEARKRLLDLTAEARRRAARGKKGLGEGDAGLEPGLPGTKLPTKVEVQGTFGKLAGLGVDLTETPAHKTAKQQLAEAKKANKHLEDINKKTQLANKLLFG